MTKVVLICAPVFQQTSVCFMAWGCGQPRDVRSLHPPWTGAPGAWWAQSFMLQESRCRIRPLNLQECLPGFPSLPETCHQESLPCVFANRKTPTFLLTETCPSDRLGCASVRRSQAHDSREWVALTCMGIPIVCRTRLLETWAHITCYPTASMGKTTATCILSSGLDQPCCKCPRAADPLNLTVFISSLNHCGLSLHICMRALSLMAVADLLTQGANRNLSYICVADNRVHLQRY